MPEALSSRSSCPFITSIGKNYFVRTYDFPSDIVMIAYGETLERLFENAAYGIAARSSYDFDAKPLYDVSVMAIGDSPELLLSDWLTQLAARGEFLGLCLVSFGVDRLEEGGVQGVGAGYQNPVGNRQNLSVDTVVRTNDGYWARVIFSDT